MSTRSRPDRTWQAATLNQLRAITADLPVTDVVTVGSATHGHVEVDEWSDLDVAVIARPGHADLLWPNRTWLNPLGAVSAWSQSAQPPGGTTRLVLTDGRRVDVIVTDEPNAQRGLAERASSRPAVSAATLDELANRILFDATLAVCKAARGERLIASHLAIGLLQRCLEAAMVRRDLAWQTSHHPRPRPEDALADLMPAVAASPTPADILDLVEAALDAFHTLTRTVEPPPTFPRQVVDDLLTRARASTR